MNKGFATYFCEGIKSSVKTIYRNGGFLYYWLYRIMSFIGRTTFFFSAAFDLANVRQAKLAHANHSACVAENFRVACKANSLWAYLGARVLEFFIAIGGILLIGVATGVFALIGLLVGWAARGIPLEYIVLIFCIPGMLAETVYLFLLPIIFAPTAYIVESNPGISAAATVSACIKTMRRGGKGTYFLTFFVPSLILGCIFGSFAGGIYLAILRLPPTESAITVFVLLMVFLAVFFIVFPLFDLGTKISQKCLFDDIALDPVNASKHTSGVNIKKCKGVLFQPDTIEENLSALFDETDNEDVPLPDSAAREKRNKAARAGEEKADLTNDDTWDRQERK